MADDKPVRARGKRGLFKGDDPATLGVNEAWEGGKGPADKSAAPKLLGGVPENSAAYKAMKLRGE